MNKTTKRTVSAWLVRALSMTLAVVCLALVLINTTAIPAQALTQSELEQQLAEYEKKLAEDKAALARLKEKTASAAAVQKNLKSQIATLQSQIALLAEDISNLQNTIGETEQTIAETEADIEAQQADINARWGDFKDRMAAMQELHDGGNIAMLSGISNLYQLLTFSEVMQDISSQDTAILDDMKARKKALQDTKDALEATKAELEQQLADLESKKQVMNVKQTELGEDLKQANLDLATAQEAQAQAQAVVDSDQMNYDALNAQIQDMIRQSSGDYSDLAFDGSFICPLKSYTRISSTFGYRTLNGVTKLHPGIDYAAPAGRKIYAAASGYVTYAGWNSGGYGYYVLIYHGQMNDGNTYSTLYAHMLQSPSVSPNQWVNQGDLIGYVGSTGNSTGNHLHLEVWQGSSASNSIANKATRVNPAYYIPA